MRKLLAALAVFAVTFNVTYILWKDIDKHVLAATRKPGPDVRVPNVSPDVIRKVKSFTVLISNEGFGGLGRGTGVLLDKRHVLTCAHLLQSWDDDLYLYFWDGSLIKGKPLAVNMRADVAIIVLDRNAKVFNKPVFQEKVQPGESMAIVGNSLGAMQWYVSGGVVSGQYRDWLLSDAFQIGGNSGGPWVNQKGEVIGIAAWGYMNHRGERIAGINGAVSAKTIKRFIWETKNPPKTLAEFLKRLVG